MNEKIKELAIKSWLVSEHKGKLLSCYREDVDLTKYLEDFAELIIRECMTICKEHPSRIVSNNWVADAVAPDVVRQFEEHFGVEE